MEPRIAFQITHGFRLICRRLDSLLCGVEQVALLASDISLRDAIFVLLRVTVGHKRECSGKDHCQQTGNGDTTSERTRFFVWFVHQSIPPLTTSPRLIGDTSPSRVIFHSLASPFG